MAFHGLGNHGWDYLITELLSTRKGNLAILTKDKPSQTQILNGTQLSITFSDVHDQILKKQFLNKVWIFVWHSKAEEINNGGYRWLFPLLKKLMSNNCCGSCSLSCVVMLQHCRMFRSHMSAHDSCAMVFVMHN
jgi:hypothetical protein